MMYLIWITLINKKTYILITIRLFNIVSITTNYKLLSVIKLFVKIYVMVMKRNKNKRCFSFVQIMVTFDIYEINIHSNIEDNDDNYTNKKR